MRPDDLLAGIIRALLARDPFSPGQVEDVVIGCTNQAGEDSRNVARHAALLAGFSIETARSDGQPFTASVSRSGMPRRVH